MHLPLQSVNTSAAGDLIFPGTALLQTPTQLQDLYNFLKMSDGALIRLETLTLSKKAAAY